MTCIAIAHQSIRIKKCVNRAYGFTLLELIGVMAVIAILAAAVLPSTINLIQVQRSVNEGGKLPEIAEALKRGMLREQVFPVYENDFGEPTFGNEGYWWNIASRHGGGSANEARYPLGVSLGSVNTRKLYFAEPSWGGKTFFQVTGDGFDWLSDPLDPRELRILLLSTTSIDLPLPGILSTENFDSLWDKWSVGNNGNPAMGTWSNYGLSSADWKGRAAELNIKRIDLRDWLSTVVIENHRAIEQEPGEIDISAISGLSGNWELGSLYSYTENQVGSSVRLSSVDTTIGSPPDESVVSQIDKIIFTKRGKIVNELENPLIMVAGTKISGTPPSASLTSESFTIALSLTNRAPVSLLDPNNSAVPLALSGWGNTDPYLQRRYFLLGQELLLGEPWNFSEVGIFVIDELFCTLRFNGLQWNY